MTHFWALLVVVMKSRLRAIVSSTTGTILLTISGLVLLMMNVLLGVGLFFVLRFVRSGSPDLVATAVSLIATWVGLVALTRPVLFRNAAGGAVTNVLHLPIRRSELLLFSFSTGVLTPLILEAPVMLGATAGLSPSLQVAPVVFAIVVLSQAVFLGTMYVVSLTLIVLTRRRWLFDLASVLGVFLFLAPALLAQFGGFRRSFLLGTSVMSFLRTISPFLPFGWGPRAAVFAGRGEWGSATVYACAAFLLFAALAFIGYRLLTRILDGEIEQDQRKTGSGAPARMWFRGGLGALIENEIRTILRLPMARAALITSSLMPAIWVAFIARRGNAGNSGLLVFLLIAGVGASNLFAFMGRRVVTVLSSPVWRAGILLSRNFADTLLRVPMFLLVTAVLVWRGRAEAAPSALAALIVLWACMLGFQNFASILRPYALPIDRANPLSGDQDGRQTAGSVLAFIMSVAAFLVSAPFLFLIWLGEERFTDYRFLASLLAVIGAFAVYALCIDFGGRLLERREAEVLEKLLDDKPV